MGSCVLRLGTVVLLAAVVGGCASHTPRCEACGRRECGNMTTTIERADGTMQRTCCPRCAAHVLGSGPRATSITVRDFDTGRPIPVGQAVFVEGSDVHPCRGLADSPPRDERGCCLRPAYDRCEPSVVAFTSTGAAGRFMERHGGLTTSWSALASAPSPS